MSENFRSIFFISGATGVGKSSIVKLFKTDCKYFEDVKGNIQIQNALRNEKFDAFLSQYWFLEQIHDFVMTNRFENEIIIDQDPFAILHVYTEYFRKRKQISNVEYAVLKDYLDHLMQVISKFNFKSKVVLLEAKPEELKKRVMKRDSKIFDHSWFDEISAMFVESYRGKDIVRIQTDNLSLEEVFSKVV